MNAPAPKYDWIEANQNSLVAEFARLKALLSGDDLSDANANLERRRAALPASASIDRLTDRFGLSSFERDLLLLAAGVEMESGFATLCAAGGVHQPWASFGLALACLPEPHWSALCPTRPLRRWRLLEVTGEASLVSARLRIDERVLHYLAGLNYLDPRLQPLVHCGPEPSSMSDGQREMAHSIANALERIDAPLPVLQLWGDDPHGRCDVAAVVADRSGLQLYRVTGEDIAADPRESEALAVLWEREAALLDGAILVECREAEPPAAALRFVERVGGLVFLGAREPVTLGRRAQRHRVTKPGHGEQRRLWEQALGPGAIRVDRAALDGVASQFRLSAHDIERAGAMLAGELVVLREPEAALWSACHDLEGLKLGALAQRIEVTAAWDDLVLAQPQKAILQQIAVHVRHRLTVYERWGFAAKSARGLGISVLFAGESGTGKTMAAEVLANELHLELYRIDLSAVVSKYIGETEKNLARLFDTAEDSGAILLFDEADALFGKRSEVKDSHDRYANIEVSYLLQRMEAYRGLAILTSNQKAALDTAFQRRLRFVVHFAFPDAAEREAIWRGVFPAATPLRDLDYAKLARLHMAGGHIRSIAVNAAFRAAEAAEPVGMTHLLEAAHAEAAKRERPLSDGETRGWV